MVRSYSSTRTCKKKSEISLKYSFYRKISTMKVYQIVLNILYNNLKKGQTYILGFHLCHGYDNTLLLIPTSLLESRHL